MLKLHPYQEKALEFCIANKTVYLAMDMGLGKTAITLKLIERVSHKAIVFAPLNVIYNTWPDEIQKWTPQLSFDILHGPHKDQILEKSEADIFLINYDGLKWFGKKMLNKKGNKYPTKKLKWGRRNLILDEASMVKDSSRLRFKTLKKLFPLWGFYRLCLSATPASNGYHELWSQYYMLDKGERLFPTYYQYRAAYFYYTGPPVYKTTIRRGAAKMIQDAIKPLTFRLDANDYLDLPEEIYNTIPVSLSTKHLKMYKELEHDFVLELENMENEISAFNAASLGMKLRQFIQGGMYTEDDLYAKTGKRPYVELHHVKLKALKELLETVQGKPLMCAIQFKFELDMIRKYIDKDVPVIAGETSVTETKRLIKEWNKGLIPFLVCHPKSASHGTNLQTGGHILLWYSLTWSLEQYQQLIGRLARQGQESDRVIIHHLIMKHTKDEDIVSVLKRKDATQAQLLQALKRKDIVL